VKVLVSSCLIGKNCKYNGGNNLSEKLLEFLKDKEVIDVCPEMLAGLGCPRPPVEILNGRAVCKNGADIDEKFRSGVALAMQIIKDKNIDLAILQSRSPTCGVNQRYDGTFSKKLINERGLFAQALIDKGYKVLDIEDL
jgi:uncharacterized protein YbbK (DUF523 family)